MKDPLSPFLKKIGADEKKRKTKNNARSTSVEASPGLVTWYGNKQQTPCRGAKGRDHLANSPSQLPLARELKKPRARDAAATSARARLLDRSQFSRLG